MLQQFADREEEMAFLEEIYSEGGFTPVVIYGRRRIGKTSLIKHFIEGKEGCYMLMTSDGMKENLRYMKECFAELLKKEYFISLDEDMYGLFRHFADEIGDKRVVLAMDEFPYLMEVKKGILSVFQKIFDEVLVNSNIMLILSGSSLSMMENDLLGYRSPLYGRKMRVWKLSPFAFKEIYRIFGDLETAMKVYFVFGNIPYYLSFYDPSIPLEENIEKNVLKKGAPLYDEPLILLRQEFRESRTYRLILKYLSLGYRSLGKLCSATGMDKGNISRYLETLKETGIVEHILPYGRLRGGIYEISDPFMRFWFRFVYPYRHELELGITDGIINRFKSRKMEFFGHNFEFLIREFLSMGYIKSLGAFGDVRRWWHKDVEIDLMGIRGETAIFVECKWKEDVDCEKVMENLRKKAEKVGWDGEAMYAVFAKSFRKKGDGCFDMNDIENSIKS